ncbi:hypothetical protein LCGC14_0318430 [marine sediment metagenome]|uniref:Uncharacterized protein n=1 Tax=marine sediment metagenome TaxID=412755 RepID=A0A0F9TK23_9ZZZZ
MSFSMNFKKYDLLEKLTENRDKHGEDFKKARKGWLKEVAEEADKVAAGAKEGDLTTVKADRGHGHRHTQAITNVLFEEPEDHTEEYERIIQMLKMSSDDEIKLSDNQFREYVQDQWGWKEAWSASNSKYLG